MAARLYVVAIRGRGFGFGKGGGFGLERDGIWVSLALRLSRPTVLPK